MIRPNLKIGLLALPITVLIGFHSHLAVAGDYLLTIVRLSDQRLQQRLNQQFSKDLTGLENLMRGEIDRSMGPYAGITNERLLDFINLLIHLEDLDSFICEKAPD